MRVTPKIICSPDHKRSHNVQTPLKVQGHISACEKASNRLIWSSLKMHIFLKYFEKLLTITHTNSTCKSPLHEVVCTHDLLNKAVYIE